MKHMVCQLIMGLCWVLCSAALSASPAASASAVASSGPVASNGRVLTYGWPAELAQDPRGAYPVQLLKLALVKGGGDYLLQPLTMSMTQNRVMQQLQTAQELDVLWAMSSPEREQQMRAIRIPIDRGLLGYRQLVVVRGGLLDAAQAARPNPSAVINHSIDIAELKRLPTVQASDWPDYQVLAHHGFAISSASDVPTMYQLLRNQRVAYVPRAISEVRAELAAAGPGLTVVPRLLLHYPNANYFFVRHEDEALAQLLEKGLRAAIADGSMLALFQQHFGADIAAADLSHCRIIELTNPQLPAATPLSAAELWFDVQRGY